MVKRKQIFASDNVVGLHPEAQNVLAEIPAGPHLAYGEDFYSKEINAVLGTFFKQEVIAFPVFNGTAANALSLAALVKSYEAIACHTFAHADLDECNAPEFFTGGAKLIGIEGENGKVCPDALSVKIAERDDVHFPRIGALSLTLSSEVGTVYTLDELAALSDICKDHRIAIHIDGARFFNALQTLDCSASEIVEASGARVLSLGMVKIGAALGEVVVFFDLEVAEGFAYRRKQAAQLSSKMAYLTAPIVSCLKSLVHNNAERGNQCAQDLAAAFQLRGIEPAFPVEANAVFVRLSEPQRAGLRERGWVFYDFVANTQRFVCHWATQRSDIEALIDDLESVSG